MRASPACPASPGRGYSIVEAGLVLAVLGLLLGATLVPLGAKLRAEKIAENRRNLEDIRQAIIAYALENRTSALQVSYVAPGGAETDRLRTRVPAGRPYLPCPDVNGDGFEDRLGFPPGGDILTVERNVTVVHRAVSVVLSLASHTPHALSISDSRVSNALVAFPNTALDNATYGIGECLRDKGGLPFGSMGAPGLDPWGNRYTYRVDPVFANAAIGFGAESRTDITDPRMPLSMTVSNGVPLTVYQRRNLTTFLSGDLFAQVNGVAAQASIGIDDSPGIVCLSMVQDTGCTPDFPADSNGRRGLLNETATVAMTLFDAYPQITVARLYEPNDVLNGMAFVVVSHGANGAGALSSDSRNASAYLNFNTAPFNSNLLCLEFTEPSVSAWEAHLPELENADHIDFCNGAVLPSNNMASTTGPQHNSAFVSLPIHDRPGGSYFDDMLVFMSGLELISEVTDSGSGMGGVWIPPGPR